MESFVAHMENEVEQEFVCVDKPHQEILKIPI